MILLSAAVFVACLFLGLTYWQSHVEKQKWKRFLEHKPATPAKDKVL